jgi:hypothetical protein
VAFLCLLGRDMNRFKNGGLTAIHILGIIAFGGIVLFLIFAETDTQKRERIEKELQTSRMAKLNQLTNQYYGNGKIVAGTFGEWKVKSISSNTGNPFSDKINNIDVRIVVDRRVAEEILWRGNEGRSRAAANGCPPRLHEIYSVLTNNDNLTLQVEVDGKIFIDVDCDRWAGDIGSPR